MPTPADDDSTVGPLTDSGPIDPVAPVAARPQTAQTNSVSMVIAVGALALFGAAALVFVLARPRTAAPASPHPIDIAVFSADRAPSLHRLRPGDTEASALIGTDGRVEFRDSDLVVRADGVETVVPRDGRPVQVGDIVIREVWPFTSPFDGVRLLSPHGTSEDPPDKGFYS